jgi:hypothetical protein
MCELGYEGQVFQQGGLLDGSTHQSLQEERLSLGYTWFS